MNPTRPPTTATCLCAGRGRTDDACRSAQREGTVVMALRRLRWAMGVAILCTGPAAWSATAMPDAAELERIRHEQQDADSRYAKASAACSKEFAVTACMDRARAERRATVDRLRREQLAISDARRAQRAADRTAEIERKAAVAPPKPARSASAPASGAAAGRPGHTDEPRLAKAPHPPASPKPHAAPHRDHVAAQQRAARQAAARASDAQQRRGQAEQHRADVLKRIAEHAGKHAPAAGLPVPAPAASVGR